VVFQRKSGPMKKRYKSVRKRKWEKFKLQKNAEVGLVCSSKSVENTTRRIEVVRCVRGNGGGEDTIPWQKNHQNTRAGVREKERVSL